MRATSSSVLTLLDSSRPAILTLYQSSSSSFCKVWRWSFSSTKHWVPQRASAASSLDASGVVRVRYRSADVSGSSPSVPRFTPKLIYCGIIRYRIGVKRAPKWTCMSLPFRRLCRYLFIMEDISQLGRARVCYLNCALMFSPSVFADVPRDVTICIMGFQIYNSACQNTSGIRSSLAIYSFFLIFPWHRKSLCASISCVLTRRNVCVSTV